MQKVKVHRYVSGKRPDYAQDQQSDSEVEDEDFLDKRNHPYIRAPTPEAEQSDEDDMNDPRLRRLRIREIDTEIRPERRRHIHEPEVFQSSDEDDNDEINLPGIQFDLISLEY